MSLFIGSPMYRGMCYGTYATSLVLLAGLCGKNNIDLQYQATLSSYISTAKNVLADEFMKSKAEYLLFIDTDIGFDPRDVFGMMDFASKGHEVIGGTYVTKAIQWDKVREAALAGKKDLSKFTSEFAIRFKDPAPQTIQLAEPLEVDALPGGFLLVSRSALNKWREAYPDLKFRERENQPFMTQFFHSEVYPDKGYISEDFWFCDKMRAIGVKIWLAPWVKLSHYGEHIFTGNLRDWADESI